MAQPPQPLGPDASRKPSAWHDSHAAAKTGFSQYLESVRTRRRGQQIAKCWHPNGTWNPGEMGRAFMTGAAVATIAVLLFPQITFGAILVIGASTALGLSSSGWGKGIDIITHALTGNPTAQKVMRFVGPGLVAVLLGSIFCATPLGTVFALGAVSSVLHQHFDVLQFRSHSASGMA